MNANNSLDHSLLILGAGGVALEVFEIIQRNGSWQTVAFLDDGDKNPHELNIIGKLSTLKQRQGQFSHAIAAVGNCVVRMEWLKNAREAGFEIPSIIHPSAVISPSAKIGSGCIVMSNTR
jgi:NDP-sugar pyrophosphorylase family protein